MDERADVHERSGLPPASVVGLMVAGMAFLFALAAYAQPGAAPQESRFTQFATEPAGARFVDWSPAGEWISFDAQDDLWVMPAEGGEAIRVTQDPAVDRAGRWSPDSRELAFASNRGGSWNIWRIAPLEGEGSATQVTADSDSLYEYRRQGMSGSWSPDGKELVFVSDRSSGRDLWVIPAAGGPARQLTTHPRDAYDPDWSPDGQWIVFSAWHGVPEESKLWIVPASGGPARQLTSHQRGDFNPSWSPDGRTVAFCSVTGGSFALWTVPVSGGTPTPVTTTRQHDDFGPRWSPDGSSLVFDRRGSRSGRSGTGRDYSIWMADLGQPGAPVATATTQRISGRVTHASDGSPWAGVPIHVVDKGGESGMKRSPARMDTTRSGPSPGRTGFWWRQPRAPRPKT